MRIDEWRYNELQQIGVDYENVEEVRRYDERMQRMRDIQSEIGILIDAVKPAPDSRVLEIGAGTGEFCASIAKHVKTVHAIDVSPVMLEYAKNKAQERNARNIEFFHAGFLTFEGEPGSYDVVYTQLALHHLPDFWKAFALKRIAAMLKRGGRFFLRDVVFPSNKDDYGAYFENLVHGFDSHGGGNVSNEVKTHIRCEYSTLDWIMEGLLTKAGLTIVESEMKNEFLSTYLCVK